MIKSKCNINDILTQAMLLNYWTDDSGAMMSITQSGGIPEELKSWRAIVEAMTEISIERQTPPWHIMVNILKPGVTIPVHTDTLIKSQYQGSAPRVERWHLPLQTNNNCAWVDDRGVFMRMELGYWYGPMPYWKEHFVFNKGSNDRVHLVVDLDTRKRVEDDQIYYPTITTIIEQ